MGQHGSDHATVGHRDDPLARCGPRRCARPRPRTAPGTTSQLSAPGSRPSAPRCTPRCTTGSPSAPLQPQQAALVVAEVDLPQVGLDPRISKAGGLHERRRGLVGAPQAGHVDGGEGRPERVPVPVAGRPVGPARRPSGASEGSPWPSRVGNGRSGWAARSPRGAPGRSWWIPPAPGSVAGERRRRRRSGRRGSHRCGVRISVILCHCSCACISAFYQCVHGTPAAPLATVVSPFKHLHGQLRLAVLEGFADRVAGLERLCGAERLPTEHVVRRRPPPTAPSGCCRCWSSSSCRPRPSPRWHP